MGTRERLVVERRSEVRQILERVLEAARREGAEYADARWVDRRSQVVRTKNGKVDRVREDHSRGVGVRVLVDGAWGFASGSRTDEESLMRIAAEAVRVARASALRRSDPPVAMASVEPVEAEWRTPVSEDPFEVKLEDKIKTLLDADRIMRQVEGVKVARGSIAAFREDKIFASTEGSYIEQSKTEVGAGIEVLAVSGGEVQRRSWPASFGGNWAACGYEYVRQLDLPSRAEQTAREAVELLDAEQCPGKVTDVILGGSQLALQIHESCGHPIELDRVLGQEASFAGTSFLTVDKLGEFQYGSEAVTITADATIPGGLGTFGYDDEGVPAQRVTIVDQGRFVGYLTSRETAGRVGLQPTGAMRADGWNRIPLIRMTNINLEPGDWSLEEIIRDTKEGILADTVKSWSIDDRRLNFQFATEVAWEIKDGSLGRMLKNFTYTGITPEFWRSCDAVGNKEEWQLWGLPNCGKGEPSQAAHVGHGAAPSRFRNVKVGVGRW